KLNRSLKVVRLRRCFRPAPTNAKGRIALILGIAMGSASTLVGQMPSGLKVPDTALGDHILKKGGKVFVMTQYPLSVEDDKGSGKAVQANSFIDCQAGEKGKDALALDDCQMYFSTGGDKFYRCNLQGKSLSIRWGHYSFLDFVGNASEEWQGALG